MLQNRVDKLLKNLPDDFEAALILNDVSRFYFLDYDADNAGTLLIFPDELVYFIDSRYIESAEETVKNATIVLETNPLEQVAQQLQKRGVKNLLVENTIPIVQYETYKEKLSGITLHAGGTLSEQIQTQREVKDAEEISRMRKAQQLTDAAFTHILPFIKAGVKEVELTLEIEHFVRRNGGDKMAFETISVAGANTSLPHGVPGDYKVQPGDFITMDFGAKYRGYCSDMTRTVALGDVSDKQRAIHALVLKAHLAGIKAAKPGAACFDVDKIARDIIADAGYGDYFGHGLGHSLGIEIHEDPRFSPKSKARLQTGMFMTVEPGCYLPGEFGCRIEDMVLITEDGCEPLPTSNKELLIL